jgi:hypothetical protein
MSSNPRPKNVLLKSQIEEAQRHTLSNRAAARYLDVHYDTYRRYAKLYDLFDSHMNKAGVGIDKGWSRKPSSIPLREILQNKHPYYSKAKLKNRLLARKKLEPKCYLCNFQEQRITDKQVPLILSFKDNNPRNMQLENLELLCYNCMFLTTGAPTVLYRRGISHSLTQEDTPHTRYYTDIPITPPDALPDSYDELSEVSINDMDKQQWLAELDDE